MKILSLALLLLTPAAYAQQVINAGPTPLCYGFCTNVPNDGGVVLNWNNQSKYQWLPQPVYVSINGDAYTGEVPAYTVDYSGVVLTDPAGNTITVSATWQSVRKCSSGRAGGCSTVYGLVSGTISIP